MSKLFQCIAFVTLLLAIVLILFIGFNLIYPYKTIEVVQPVPVCKEVYRPGETLGVCMDYVKHTDQSARVQRAFIDGVIFSLPVYKSSYLTGKHCIEDITTVIPESLPAGTYYMHVIIEYDFPPFRTVTYTFDTQKFTVVR